MVRFDSFFSSQIVSSCHLSQQYFLKQPVLQFALEWCFTVLFSLSFQMAPKKGGYGEKKGKGDEDNSPPNTGGAASSTDFHVDMDKLLEMLASMSLSDKEEMEKNCTAEIKDLCLKLKSIKSSMKEEKKAMSAEERKARAKEAQSKKKEEDKAHRESEVSLTVRINGQEFIVRVPLNTTVGQLRKDIARVAKLPPSHSLRMSVSFGGLLISSTPRKTLNKCGIATGAVLECSINPKEASASSQDVSIAMEDEEGNITVIGDDEDDDITDDDDDDEQ